MARQIMALGRTRHLSQMRGPELHTLIKRLGDFLFSCVDLYFVWDSTDRPVEKQKTFRQLKECWFFEDFRTAVDKCGFTNIYVSLPAFPSLHLNLRLLGLLIDPYATGGGRS